MSARPPEWPIDTGAQAFILQSYRRPPGGTRGWRRRCRQRSAITTGPDDTDNDGKEEPPDGPDRYQGVDIVWKAEQ